MTLHPTAKVNLFLSVIRRREDGFHELETLFHKAPIADQLTVTREGAGIELTCDDPSLPVDADNLVYLAAQRFFQESGLPAAARIHLAKRIPHQAGLGGGSSDAAATLQALNQTHENPLPPSILHSIAAELGSDVPYFLMDGPALAVGRGEKLKELGAFPALEGHWFVLAKPEFGVPTGWAYGQLAHFDGCLGARMGEAEAVAQTLAEGAWPDPDAFFNSFEGPVFHKFPVLGLIRDHFLQHGARASLLSGSGAAVFAIFSNESAARSAQESIAPQFGAGVWSHVAPHA